MAQIDKNLYDNIATNLGLLEADLDASAVDMRAAMFNVTNIDTSTYNSSDDPSIAGEGDEDAAIEALLALSPTFGTSNDQFQAGIESRIG